MPSKPKPPDTPTPTQAARPRPRPQAAAQRKAAVSQTPVSPEQQTIFLVQRMAMLEAEQKAARERIEQLTQAKTSFEHAITRIRAQKEASVQQQAHTEKLLQELSVQVGKKESEQAQLREKIETIRIQAEQEIISLRAERDAAMRLAEQRKQEALDRKNESNPPLAWQRLLSEHLHFVLIAGSVVLVLLMLVLILLIRLLA